MDFSLSEIPLVLGTTTDPMETVKNQVLTQFLSYQTVDRGSPFMDALAAGKIRNNVLVKTYAGLGLAKVLLNLKKNGITSITNIKINDFEILDRRRVSLNLTITTISGSTTLTTTAVA